MGERIKYSNEEVATHLPNTEPSLLLPGVLPDRDYSPERFVHKLYGRLSHIGREGLQVILGAIWIVDGLLQLQPYMYEKGSNGLFGTVALETMGRPNAINDFLAFMVRHMVAHEAISNTSIVLVQVAIGALLVWSGLQKHNQITRVTLAVSIAWAFMVWVVGEGIGGMIMPQASMLTGAPGAAILYALAAIYLWPPKDHSEDTTEGHVPAGIRNTTSDGDGAIANHGLLGTTGSYIAWAILWCGSSLLEFQYGNFAPNSISAQIRYEAINEPKWLSFMDLHLASTLHGNGTVLAGILLVVEFAIGWLVLRPATRKFALIAGILLAALFWVVGQNLGTVFSGQATDLNSGPLLILLALLLWPRSVKWPRDTSRPSTTISTLH